MYYKESLDADTTEFKKLNNISSAAVVKFLPVR